MRQKEPRICFPHCDFPKRLIDPQSPWPGPCLIEKLSLAKVTCLTNNNVIT